MSRQIEYQAKLPVQKLIKEEQAAAPTASHAVTAEEGPECNEDEEDAAGRPSGEPLGAVTSSGSGAGEANAHGDSHHQPVKLEDAQQDIEDVCSSPEY